MPCVFCAIIRGEAEAALVDSTEHAVVFLDRRPLFVGHCLVVPRTHYETLVDLPPDAIASYFGVVQEVARALPDALDARGTFVAINNGVSQSVPHLHTHVVPRRPGDGLRGFFWPRTKYEGGPSEMESYAQRIRTTLQRLRGTCTS